jgi:NAD(P)-dependent dehydrogenase (short-subunit alcohol dehydrogenase family)
MSLWGLIKGKRGPSGFGFASTAEEVTAGLDLSGKTVLITGVNSGIGQETARVLALRGARVVGAARSVDKATEVCAALGPSAIPVACELSEPTSIRACVDEVEAKAGSLDVILCNAGIMMLPELTLKHGQELQFLTNHVGHFMLVTGLLERLADAGRVVMVSSSAHGWAPPGGVRLDDLTWSSGGYSPSRAYGQSKLANILFARALARRLQGTKKTANALHPGAIATNLVRHMNPFVRAAMPLAAAVALKSIPQGAATQSYVATHPALEGVSGEYFSDCNVARSSRYARDEGLAERLWEASEEIVQRLDRA